MNVTATADFCPPTHAGEVLLSESLNPLELSQEAFADYIDLPVQRINEIVCGKRGISSETALLCAEALDTNPEFWLNFQTNYDLVRFRPKRQVERITAWENFNLWRGKFAQVNHLVN